MSGRIRQLPPTLINRIAAGEVVERPASAVKELVENALDAQAGRIDVTLEDGGRGLIAVVDDGVGMTPDELTQAVERHCTSKLAAEADLSDIRTLGFRGEALPSIGSVARLTLTSRPPEAAEAWRIIVDAGALGAVEPAAHPPGTRVEVCDLFHATPARLKFLKAARTEQGHAVDILRRLAMAHPAVAFTLADGRRMVLRAPALAPDLLDDLHGARRARLGAVLGRDVAENAVTVDVEREGARLSGLAGLPTFHKATSQDQFLFVNGRPVRDRLLHGAVRGAYQDFLARDRHPVVVLYLDIDPAFVDVNVHPGQGRSALPRRRPGEGADRLRLRHALAGAGHRASTTVAAGLPWAAPGPKARRRPPRRVCPCAAAVAAVAAGATGAAASDLRRRLRRRRRRKRAGARADPDYDGSGFARRQAPERRAEGAGRGPPGARGAGRPLGVARAQVHSRPISSPRPGMGW